MNCKINHNKDRPVARILSLGGVSEKKFLNCVQVKINPLENSPMKFTLIGHFNKLCQKSIIQFVQLKEAGYAPICTKNKSC